MANRPQNKPLTILPIIRAVRPGDPNLQSTAYDAEHGIDSHYDGYKLCLPG